MNPLGYSEFGFATANEAEPAEEANGGANGSAEAKMEVWPYFSCEHLRPSVGLVKVSQ